MEKKLDAQRRHTLSKIRIYMQEKQPKDSDSMRF